MKPAAAVLAGGSVFIGLYFAGRYSYTLFHSLAETFAIVVACGIFMIAWNTRRILDNAYLLFIGIAYLFIGGIDLLHTLSYKGMGVFPGYGSNLPTQLWIAGRFMESVTLLIAPLWFGRRIRTERVLLGYAAVFLLLILSIFSGDLFPACFVEGKGLTPFKIGSEYLICLMLTGSGVLLYRHRARFDARVFKWVIGSIGLTVLAELAFTFYISVYGFSNLMGHFLKILSFYFIYRAIIQTGLAKPYRLLLRDLKASEESLRASEERWRVTLTSIGDAVLATDTGGRITFLNPVAEKVTGWKADEAMGQPVRQVFRIISEATRQPAEDIVGRVLREGHVVNLANHTALIDREGREIPIADSAAPIRSASGQVAGAVVVFHDITERKQAETALHESRERFRLLSETAGRLLASDTPQELVEELCVKVMEHLDCQAFFNFLMDGKAGRLRLNAWAGIPEADARTIEWLDLGVAVCGCVAQGGKPIIAENIPGTPDIRTDLVRSYGIQAYACHPLIIQGRLIGTLSFGTRTRPFFSPGDLALMRVVTDQVATAMERVQLIEALQRSRDDLEERVRERTAALARSNTALREHVIKLEQLNQELKEFSWIASHDLQEPLRKIQTFGGRLERSQESLTPGGRADLLRMIQSARRMAALIRSLKSYSEITRENDGFEPADLTRVAREAASEMELAVQEAGGRIEVAQLPTMEVEPTKMRQLFQNLIQNAIKFAREGEPPVVTITGRVTDGMCRIKVADNGIGFDKKYLDKIFAPFQRLHGRESPYAGTGMGLAICRKVAELHGGTITARSAPGKGTAFIIEMPLGQEKGTDSHEAN